MITKQKNKPLDTELYLSLDSPVYIVEKKNGKQISKDPIDSNLVLKLILSAIESSVYSLVEELDSKPVKKKVKHAKKTR